MVGADVIASHEGATAKRKLLLLVLFGAFCDGFEAISMPFLIPHLSPDWLSGAGGIEAVLASSLVGTVIGSLAVDHFAARYGIRSTMAATLGLATVAMLGCSLASGKVFLVGRLLTGVGIGAAMPLLLKTGSDLGSPDSRSGRMHLVFAGYTAGGLAAGCVGLLIGQGLPWRAMLMAGAALGGVATLTIIAVPPARWPRSGTSGGRQAPVSFGELLSPQYHMLTLSIWVLLFCSLLDLQLIGSWMPSLLLAIGGTEQGAGVASLFQLGGTLSLLGLACVGRRIVRRRVLALAFVTAAVAFLGLAAMPSTVVAIPALFAAGIGLMTGQFGSTSRAGLHYGDERLVGGLAVAMGIGRLGSLVGFVAGAALLRWASPELACLALAVPLLVAALMTMGLRHA